MEYFTQRRINQELGAGSNARANGANYATSIAKQLYLTSAKHISEYNIQISFSDGLEKIVDLKPHLWGKIFEPLLEIRYFSNFKIIHNTIEWTNGADFAPEFLYDLPEVIFR